MYKSNFTGCFTTPPLLGVYEMSSLCCYVVLISGSWTGELSAVSCVFTGELAVASGSRHTADSQISIRFDQTWEISRQQ